ncbi:ubiquinone/menaquinone biosynthesis C-methylase UbiE [Streptomyces sp. V4I8]|uniref:methyltransferase n=1 Tax=Streptomyces sp. V4I8 TaxID=3156469 RepID=UPI0035117841
MSDSTLSEAEVDLLLHGHVTFHVLNAAHELGLFDYLAAHPGCTEDQTANAVGLDSYPFEVLTGALRCLGLIISEHGGLHNSPAAARLLVSSSPSSRTALLGLHRELFYPVLGDLVASLRESTNVGLRNFPGTGDDLYTRLSQHPALEKVLHSSLSALSSVAIQGLIETQALKDSTYLLDIGGGDASNAIALAGAYDRLNITLVDEPTVLDIAAKKIRESGCGNRIRLHAANFLTDPLPAGADTILFAHVMPIFSPEINTSLLTKAHRALPPGGRALVFNTMQDDTQEGPVMAMLGSVYFLALASGQGRYYAWSHYENWFRKAGFSSIQRHASMPYSHGLCIATK